MHGGASNGHRERRRNNKFAGISMSSYLDILSLSAHGMSAKGNSGGDVQREAGNTGSSSGEKLELLIHVCESRALIEQ